MLRKAHFLGVGITDESEDKILEYFFSSLEKVQTKYIVVTPNPEILVYAHDHPEYRKILNEAKIALPDGIGVFLGSALLGQRLKERIPGVDFIEEVCKKTKGRPVSMGFLGAGPGVAKLTAECLIKKYPWIKVRFVGEEWRSPYISPADPIDILFVAFGFPKQEEWISRNLARLPVKVAMGVGGAFDYISGEVIRAPFMVRAVGFEWLFRLFHQPWRWKRQLVLMKFVWLVLREWVGSRE